MPGSVAPSTAGSAPTVPFTSQVTGTQSQTSPDSQGNIQVTLAMHLDDPAATPLTVVLDGSQSGGGVSLSSGTVSFGPYKGQVTGLNGGTVVGTVSTPGPVTLTVTIQVGPTDRSTLGQRDRHRRGRHR